MITFTVTGHPEPQGSTKGFIVRNKHAFPVPTPEETMRVRKRFRVATTSDNPSLAQWRQLVALAAGSHVGGGPIQGGVHITLDFTLQRPKSLPKRERQHLKKPDIDKLARAILDALTGILFPDDSEVVRLEVTKRYAAIDAAPGVSITIVPVSEVAPAPAPAVEAREAVLF